MSGAETVVVTHADREKAWPYISANSLAGCDRAGFFSGQYDDCAAVQAFARHRLATQADALAVMREAEEATPT